MKSKFALILGMAAMLASCGGTPASSPSTQPSTTSEASSEASSSQGAKYLTWIADNKLVVELYSTAEARFTYGNAALPNNSNTVDLADSAIFACSQGMAGMTFNFVFVAESEGAAAVAVFKAIEGDQLVEFCNLHNDDLKGKTRGYIAVSGGSEVQWAKGKNADLDVKIQSYINIG